MSDSFIVSFEKDDNYQRFLVTQVLHSVNRDMVSIELCEETTPPLQKIIIPSDTPVETIRNESNVVNIIHATMTTHIENIPNIIQSLQSLYDNYRKSNEGEPIGDSE